MSWPVRQWPISNCQNLEGSRLFALEGLKLASVAPSPQYQYLLWVTLTSAHARVRLRDISEDGQDSPESWGPSAFRLAAASSSMVTAACSGAASDGTTVQRDVRVPNVVLAPTSSPAWPHSWRLRSRRPIKVFQLLSCAVPAWEVHRHSAPPSA